MFKKAKTTIPSFFNAKLRANLSKRYQKKKQLEQNLRKADSFSF